MNPTLDAIADGPIGPLTGVAHLKLSPAELWLVLQFLGEIDPDAEPPQEVAARPDGLHRARNRARNRARTSLIYRGILLTNAQGDFYLSADVAAMVGVTAEPQTLLTAQITNGPTTGQSSRFLCCSQAPEIAVLNWVDVSAASATPAHHFVRLDPGAVVPGVLAQLAQWCDWNLDHTQATVLNEQDTIRALERATQTVILTQVIGPSRPRPQVHVMGWIVAERRAWRVQQQGNAERALQPAAQADIMREITRFLESHTH